MTQETNDVVGLIERLELSASESEMGRNLAGTPQTCRAAKARLQSQFARIAELEGALEAARPKYAQSCFDHEYITPGCPDCGKMA